MGGTQPGLLAGTGGDQVAGNLTVRSACAHLGTGRPLAVPRARLALVLSTVQAKVLVAWSASIMHRMMQRDRVLVRAEGGSSWVPWCIAPATCQAT